jgi:hypothetical protein
MFILIKVDKPNNQGSKLPWLEYQLPPQSIEGWQSYFKAEHLKGILLEDFDVIYKRTI